MVCRGNGPEPPMMVKSRRGRSRPEIVPGAAVFIMLGTLPGKGHRSLYPP